MHAFNNINDGFKTLAFFNGDHAVLANFLESLGHHGANFLVVVRGNTGDGCNATVHACHWLGQRLNVLCHNGNGFANAAHQGVGFCAAGDKLQAAAENGLGKNGGGGCSVAGVIAGLACGFLHKLRAHVFSLVGKFNFFGNTDAVLGHGWSAPTFIQHRVASAWTKRALDGGGQFFYASQK